MDALRQLNPLAEESVLHNIIVGTHHCNTTYYNMSDTLGSSLDWRIVRGYLLRRIVTALQLLYVYAHRYNYLRIV